MLGHLVPVAVRCRDKLAGHERIEAEQEQCATSAVAKADQSPNQPHATKLPSPPARLSDWSATASVGVAEEGCGSRPQQKLPGAAMEWKRRLKSHPPPSERRRR